MRELWVKCSSPEKYTVY
uniref:Uncharacterized protein n=1 Tax=Arundo donax TaxID=35708 RepID=A0A0A9HLK8_ARUDO